MRAAHRHRAHRHPCCAPEGTNNDNPRADDGLHLTDAGKVKLIENFIRECDKPQFVTEKEAFPALPTRDVPHGFPFFASSAVVRNLRAQKKDDKPKIPWLGETDCVKQPVRNFKISGETIFIGRNVFKKKSKKLPRRHSEKISRRK